MANPPISIGPFTNVPAPGSPIRSDWSQQASTLINAIYPGPRLWTFTASTPVQVFAGGTMVTIGTFTPPAAGLYLLHIDAVCRCTSAGEMNLAPHLGSLGPGVSCLFTDAGHKSTIPLTGMFNLATVAPVTVQIQGSAPQGTGNWVDARHAFIIPVKAP